MWRWKKRKKKKKNQGPRYVSGPGGGDAGVEGGRRSRGRVLTRLELLLLVEEGGSEGEGLKPLVLVEGGREGEGLETRFDVSRASIRSSKEGGREGEGLETHFDASRASVARQRVEGRERVSRRVLTRLEPLSLVEGGWKGGRGLVLKVVALARHTL